MKNENVEDRRALLRGGRRYVMAYGCARAWATLTFTGQVPGRLAALREALRVALRVALREALREALRSQRRFLGRSTLISPSILPILS